MSCSRTSVDVCSTECTSLRRADIETEVELNDVGAEVESIEIDAWVTIICIGYRF